METLLLLAGYMLIGIITFAITVKEWHWSVDSDSISAGLLWPLFWLFAGAAWAVLKARGGQLKFKEK